jgi:hypothetical protein
LEAQYCRRVSGGGSFPVPEYDAGFKIVARTAGRQLAQVAGVTSQQWAPIVSEVQTTERLADRAFRARRGRERFVVYMEAYTYWKAAAPWSMLAKSGLLSERERLPTVSLLYILRPRGYRRQGGNLRLAVGGQPTQQVWFQEVPVWEVQPQRWWEAVPGLMALYPLCRHSQPAHGAQTHAAGAIVAGEADTIVRADLLTTLAIFGKLVHPSLDVFRLIGREQMKESKFYQEILQEGHVEAQREDVLEVLRTRFGARAVADYSTLLAHITDIDRLRDLLRLAAGCKRLDDFHRRLRDE